MAAKITVEVIKKEQVTDKVYFVTFRLVDPPTIDFRAGQNMMLMIAPGINRTMSIASPSHEKSELLMVHDVSPMGPGSKWTLGLKVGDKATVVAPTGGILSFIDSPKKKVMVATGTGIAPFHAMILDKPSYLMSLYWGLRYEEDVYWETEFETIAALNTSFRWQLILSQPTQSWTGARGHVTEHLFSSEKDFTNSEFYLCGNKAMIEDVRNKLLERNVQKEHIKTELFY